MTRSLATHIVEEGTDVEESETGDLLEMGSDNGEDEDHSLVRPEKKGSAAAAAAAAADEVAADSDIEGSSDGRSGEGGGRD
jgi:hypothetical protein